MTERQKTQSGLADAPNLLEKEDEIIIDPVDLFYRLLGSWKMILCLALAFAVAVGAATVLFVMPQYKATSILYVLSPESVINVSSLQLGTALTSDYIKVFDMWEVHEEVLSNLGLDYSYTQARNMLSVTNTQGTRMLDISVTSPSPSEAALMANEYAKVASKFIQETMAIDKPNIMSRALEPANPVSPRTGRNIAIGFFGGALLGAAIVVCQCLGDDKLKTAEEIRQYTGLATLAVVPVEDGLIDPDEKKHRKGRKRG